MSNISIILSPADVKADLNLVMPNNRCKVQLLMEEVGAMCVCVNTPSFETGFTTRVLIIDGETSFAVEEFANDTEYGNYFEDVHNVDTYEQALDRIGDRADFYTAQSA